MASVTLPARHLIVAPRLPERSAAHTGNPFTSQGEIVVDCDVPGCGWHAFGTRVDVKKAWDTHYRQWHAAAQEEGVLLINHPRQ